LGDEEGQNAEKAKTNSEEFKSFDSKRKGGRGSSVGSYRGGYNLFGILGIDSKLKESSDVVWMGGKSTEKETHKIRRGRTFGKKHRRGD